MVCFSRDSVDFKKKMKDLTDYFSSPTKTVKGNGRDPELTRSSSHEDKAKPELSDSRTSPENERKKKKKKSRRKRSDPAVKNVADLLTTSLCIISPNTSFNDQSREVVNEHKENEAACAVVVLSEEETKPKNNKLNAFQYMMESRHKSLGRNSPGKDISEDEKKICYKIGTRKKGAAKRKREEEQMETINYKLEKRRKRMKKLLGGEAVVRTPKRKRILTSSSESTTDSCLDKEADAAVPNSALDIIEEDAQDVRINESKAKETKQGLLSFFGVVNKSKQKDENVKTKRRKSHRKSFNRVVDADDTSEESVVFVKESKTKKKKQSLDQASSKTPKSKSTRELDQDFTPRSAKSWKMKIKLQDESSKEGFDQPKTKDKKLRKASRVLLSEDSSSSAALQVYVSDKTGSRSQSKPFKEDAVVICSEDESEEKRKQPSKLAKVAPVFARASPKPKPKLAPEVVQARKQFLLSGMPDALKKTMEKQQIVEEMEYSVFPSVSHVQQKCPNPFWNLPSPQLALEITSPLKQKPAPCTNLTNSRLGNSLSICREVEKVDKLKTLLNKIKSDNPNYPVYKSFRSIYEKSGRAKGRKRASKAPDEINPETNQSMWTDKYKPGCSEDIIGNAESVRSLKKNFSEEINAKRKRREYCSDSEFESTDCDSRDSTKLPGNTVVVAGPPGSGKSTAVYAICDELGFNVIELNASSKRTGKRLLQELQEATQSHQVRKKKQAMKNFLTSKDSKASKGSKEKLDRKMCVLLVEDVDVVFEQDDGFVSALNQLVSTSKRPVVVTTSDTSSVLVQKFIDQYESIYFMPLSSQSLATWLQILCLVEGLYVDQSDVGSLLEFNKGDARKTLLQLQFWVQSGGQLVPDNLTQVKIKPVVDAEEEVLDDEQEPCLEDDHVKEEKVFVHSGCIKSFEVFKHHKSYRVPFYLNLGLLWWNLPNVLGIRSFSEERLEKFKDNYFEKVIAETMHKESVNKKPSLFEKQKLECLSALFDSLAFTDVSLRTVKHYDGLEPGVKYYSSGIKDSLELEETVDDYDGHKELVQELTHSLVNDYIDKFNYIESKPNQSVLNIAVPDKAERRWRAKLHVCEEVFQVAVPVSVYTDRASLALDYMPWLRNISRSESRRAANNTKRRNRFRSYLRDLGIKYNDNTKLLGFNFVVEHDYTNVEEG
ncbi:hypothetical protein NQ315_001545, partial [Exocentrus adspersus]